MDRMQSSSLVVAALALLGCSCAPALHALYREPITTREGWTFQVKLRVKLSPGHSWVFSNEKAVGDTVELISDEILYQSKELRPDAWGDHIFTFRSIKADTIILDFWYKHPWESKDGIHKKVAVNIKPEL